MVLRVTQVCCKLIQRQTYTCLSRHYGIWFLFTALTVVIVAAFHFGEVWLQWSASHYAGNFQFARYYDNIVGKSFQSRLCLPQPIDVVYTWVNGSDPKLIVQLNALKKKLREQVNSLADSGDAKARSKLINSDKFKWKVKTVCPLPNCVPAYKLAISGVPTDISRDELGRVHSNFSSAKTIESRADDNIIMVTFEKRAEITSLMSTPLKYKSVSLNTSEVFYTSIVRSGHQKLDTTLMFLNVDVNTTIEELGQEVGGQIGAGLVDLQLHDKDNIAVATFLNQEVVYKLKAMSVKRNFTVNHRTAKVLPVTYSWYPVTTLLDEEEDGSGSNRFADNDELRYSLRSVEKFAPWVRRIYIVTNGQIPHWLNLNHPRVHIVTHEEIFTNKSHLPTFSSPAIETHIHRIPGLSKRFVYMNDDVFFGAPVWPDDFYTHSKGQKVFLSWAVPNCNEGCPSSWVNDKYCDKACNVSACEWDGGDCLGVQASNKFNLAARYNAHTKTTGDNCNPGCGQNWIGDRYCDANCNNPRCGFDGGDCGTKDLYQLFSYTLKKGHSGNGSHIMAPKGTLAMYVNLTSEFDYVIEGNFQDSSILRTAVISKKFKLLSLTFYKNISATTVSFQVLGYRGKNKTHKAVTAFQLTVDTVQKKEVAALGATNITAATMRPTVQKVPKSVYNETSMVKGNLRTIIGREVGGDVLAFPSLADLDSLPQQLRDKLKEYKEELAKGHITQLGFNRSVAAMYEEHVRTSTGNGPGRKLLWLQEDVGTHERSFDNHLHKDLGKGDFSKRILQKHSNDFKTTLFSPFAWEKGSFLSPFHHALEKRLVKEKYRTKSFHKRRILDAFSSSLLHVSRLYNKQFGYLARKVPAHMPHMVNGEIIEEMQKEFAQYFDATSSHRVRHPEDMQFAFSYNYYVIGKKVKANLSEVFDKVDTDHSGWLSDREQRTLAAVLYPLPLSLNRLKLMESHIKNCSQRLKPTSPQDVPRSPTLLITKQLFLDCHELWRNLNITNELKKFNHEIEGEEDVIFKMIRNNATYVLHQLDRIRKDPKKFICLNDDLDHAKASTKTIRIIMRDFYESLFPLPSQFELPLKFRNKFQYKWEVDDWLRKNREQKVKLNYVVVAVVVVAVFLCVLRLRLLRVLRGIWNWVRPRGRQRVWSFRTDKSSSV